MHPRIRYPRNRVNPLRCRGSGRIVAAAAHELMQGEGDFVGMRCAPCNDSLQLNGIVGDSADFHEVGFDDLRVSHRNSSMAHAKGRWLRCRFDVIISRMAKNKPAGWSGPAIVAVAI